MTLAPSGFRFVRSEGLHYCYERLLRGRWTKCWVFAESQQLADEKVVERYGWPHVAYAIRRAGEMDPIWRYQQKPKSQEVPW